MKIQLNYPQSLLYDPRIAIATWFGVGFFPFAPGTMGSIVAVLLAWPISHYLGILGLFIGAISVSIIGVWVSNYYEKYSQRKDSSEIVIDEVAGQWFTLLLVPPDPIYYALGFGIFRLMDIIKPWPISFLDKKIKGGLGVVLDDCVAGIFASLILWIIWIWTSL